MESKSHYKLYKKGKIWCAMAIATVALGIGMANNVQTVKAADQTSTSLTTSAGTTTDVSASISTTNSTIASSSSVQATNGTESTNAVSTAPTAEQATSSATQTSSAASDTKTSASSAVNADSSNSSAATTSISTADSSASSAVTGSDTSSQATTNSDESVLISDTTENGVRTINKALAANTAANGLYTQNGETYYYANGVAKTGLQTVNGHEYYFDTNTGAMKTNYFLNQNGNMYYFGENGQKFIKQFYSNWNKVYYFGENDGARYTNQFYSGWGNMYYFGSNGARYTNQFYSNWNKMYYFGNGGVRYTNQFYSGWGNMYYFGGNGARYTNQFYNNWGHTYYFGDGGVRYTNKFYHNWGNLYYFGGNGALNTNSSFYYNGVKFIANSKGILNLENAINSYIISNKLGHATIQTNIWSGYPTTEMNYEYDKPEGVVVHETANTGNDSINMEINYAESNWKNAFVHSYVSDKQIVNVANTDLKCWGSGAAGNARFVQFEQIEVHSKAAFAKELNNAAYYTAYLLKEYGLTPSLAKSNKTGTVWSHHNVSQYLGGTDHTDPDGYWSKNASSFFRTSYSMNTFLPLVEYYFVQM